MVSAPSLSRRIRRAASRREGSLGGMSMSQVYLRWQTTSCLSRCGQGGARIGTTALALAIPQGRSGIFRRDSKGIPQVWVIAPFLQIDIDHVHLHENHDHHK